jgi:putative ABC transport system permease protein
MIRSLRAWAARLSGLFGRDRREQELRDEIDSHLQMHVEDCVRAGLSPGEARRQALLRLGGVEGIKEEYRDRRGVPMLEHLAQDTRFAVRVLWRTPAFTAVAVLTLGLGIGANTAVFSVVNAVLLRPLPFPQSDRLTMIWATNTKNGGQRDVASYPDFEEWKASSRSFDGMAAFTSRGVTLAGPDQAVLAPALQTTPGFFETLGVLPALGRTFQQSDLTKGEPRVAVLSDAVWRRQFGGRTEVLGEPIRLNEELYTIVGVMPGAFVFDPVEPEQIYTLLAPDPNRNHGFLRIIGRLRHGVSRSSAQAEMGAIADRIARDFPKSNATVGVNIMPLVDAGVGDARTGLLFFLGVVTLVLLIACTNVANLMLARNAQRERELAIRTAMGAGRRRLIQQLLTESLVLSLAGGILGLMLANWGTRVLVVLLSTTAPIPRIEATHSDWWVLGFAFALSLVTGILFGVVPALVAAPEALNDTLRESSRSVTASTRGRRARACLMIAETALALVLLAGAGMLLKTLFVLRSTGPGFTAENVLTVEFRLPEKRLAATGDRAAFYSDLLARVHTISGVGSAALVADLPLNNSSNTMGFKIPGRGDKFISAKFNIVSAGYFRTMEIPVRAGREFVGQDRTNTEPVVVVNDAAARRFWPGENAVGKQILLPTSRTASTAATVVGVVSDVRQIGLGIATRPEIFLNSLQRGPGWPYMVLVVRTSVEPTPLAGAIKDAARAVDRDVPIARLRALDEVLAGSLAQTRVYTALLAAFAGLALVLAMVGLYGVVSYSVAQRTHEIGIRMALGAGSGDVMRMVLRNGAAYAIAGTAIGLAGAVAFMRLLATMLPGARAGDPGTLTAVCVLLLGVALAASYIPARRGSRVDPVVALRNE